MRPKDFLNRSEKYVLPIIALIIPTGWFLSYAAFIVGIFSLYYLVKNKFQTEKSKFTLFLPAVLFLLSLISLFYSHDLGYGLFELEVKLVMLLFPFFFNYLPKKSFDLNLISISFIIGYFISIFYHIVIACMNFKIQGWQAFYYNSFTGDQHPTYLSMYGTFCIVLLQFLNRLHRNKILSYITLLALVISIVFLGSKAGMIAMAIVIIFCFVYNQIKTRIRELSYVLTLAFCVQVITQLFIMHYVSDRAVHTARELNMIGNESTVKNNIESTNARKAALSSAVYLIIKSPLIGYGCGDVQNKLNERYLEQDLTMIKAEQLNAHNEYLQVVLETGIVGGLVLLIWILSFFYISKNFDLSIISIGFGIIILVHFMFESMLERQIGIMFVLFWHSIVHRLSNSDIYFKKESIKIQ